MLEVGALQDLGVLLLHFLDCIEMPAFSFYSFAEIYIMYHRFGSLQIPLEILLSLILVSHDIILIPATVAKGVSADWQTVTVS